MKAMNRQIVPNTNSQGFNINEIIYDGWSSRSYSFTLPYVVFGSFISSIDIFKQFLKKTETCQASCYMAAIVIM